MMRTVLLVCAIFILSFWVGCSGDSDEATSGYPKYSGQPEPYILKEGCTFKIVTEQGSASVSSPKVSGGPGASATGSVSLGDYKIEVSDCDVVGNPSDLPIYEK